MTPRRVVSTGLGSVGALALRETKLVGLGWTYRSLCSYWVRR
jgi:hypothetical protein